MVKKSELVLFQQKITGFITLNLRQTIYSENAEIHYKTIYIPAILL